MAYTPELDLQHSRTLRRIAWSMDMPMTKAMAEIFDWLPGRLDKEKICESCRDRRLCEVCVFRQ
jgi:hypothetical protein